MVIYFVCLRVSSHSIQKDMSSKGVSATFIPETPLENWFRRIVRFVGRVIHPSVNTGYDRSELRQVFRFLPVNRLEIRIKRQRNRRIKLLLKLVILPKLESPGLDGEHLPR